MQVESMDYNISEVTTADDRVPLVNYTARPLQLKYNESSFFPISYQYGVDSLSNKIQWNH